MAKLHAEQAAEAATRAEVAALSAELEQYEGWIADTLEGGGVYRLSKALIEERDRRAALERETSALRSKLAVVSSHVNGLTEHAAREPPQAVQARAADDALRHLNRLREISADAAADAASAQAALSNFVPAPVNEAPSAE